MAIYTSALMADSLNKKLIRETEARGDVRRIVTSLSAAQIALGANNQFILGRIKYNAAINSISIRNMGAANITNMTARIGVWGYNPDTVSVGEAAANYQLTGTILNFDTFGGTTNPAGLLTGAACFLSTNVDGTVIALQPNTLTTVSGITPDPFLAVAGNTSILNKGREQVTIRQIVEGLDDADPQNVLKASARRALFAGQTPYSNVDCLIVLDIGIEAGTGGPLLFTIEYVEGTVSNMVSTKTSPVYP
jgi:hypothetical protein